MFKFLCCSTGSSNGDGRTMDRYLDLYQPFSSVVENCCLQTTNCHVDKFTPMPMNEYMKLSNTTAELGIARIAERIKSSEYDKIRGNYIDTGHECPLVTIDSTPRYLYDGNHWKRDVLNIEKKSPETLTPDRIHHFVPNAKIIILLRDPLERIMSSYRFFEKQVSAERFHESVVNFMT